ncbi:FtsH protease activity modulator HflK [Thalassolituus oleivorans]|uniref:FtsH protease activity modulator HflK n=1 Tax=Thalassolituus oleivorans TaxID=187493 RepID=UPI000C98B23D|nr:FtsH protease activity modulator HflK [Thalassolituus oleivorans]MAD44934.1 FtsH protease activity modulator HflK [Oceanospirillaceae bacterium]MCP5016086.1 FtsH protease activity modulator HflK [Ketobacter sp.]|tara:strand:- start:34480 stop:35460 length:981 start_codon:yes stop_codon:yes gene_type:complete
MNQQTNEALPDIPVTPRQIIIGVVIALVIYVGYSSYYTVSAESVGVVQRFGHYHYVVEPGLHFKIPFGVDQVIQVPIKRQLKEEFGFGTPGATFTKQMTDPREWELETTIVTGDLNTALVEWVIQFRIENAFDFLFKVRDPGDALRDISESVMREVIGDRTVDEVLTIGRQDIEASAQIKMQEVVNLYEMGLRIDQVQLKNVNPPKPVQASFDEVNEAQQERERMINVARGEYNKAVPQARGTAERSIQAAQGYAVQRVNQAEGDAAKFNALLAEYVKAPEVTRRRLYLETMQEVLPAVKNKIVLDDRAASVLPLLQLNTMQGGAQ